MTDTFEAAKDAFPTGAVYGPTAAPRCGSSRAPARSTAARYYMSNLIVYADPARRAPLPDHAGRAYRPGTTPPMT